METRKIQQVGGGTFTVSLPKEWADGADIEPGATVALHTHIDGTLVVRAGAEGGDAPAPLTVPVAGLDPAAVEQTLRAAYTAGMDTVELVSEDGFDGDRQRTVERITRDLTGVTVTESADERLRVRSLLDAGEVSIPQSVRQLQFAALSAHRDASEAVTTADRAADLDGQTDRIVAMVDHYVRRGLDSLAVMDQLGLTRPALFVRWVTARELDRVADDAERIAAVAGRLDAPVDGELADAFDALAERSRGLVRDAVSVVLDDAVEGGPASDQDEATDVATARRLLEECETLRSDVRALDRQLFETDGTDYRLAHALDGVRRTADSAATIANVGLQTRLRERQSDGVERTPDR